MELNIDQEFWEDFVQEAFEHIEEIEMKVLTLEKEPDNEEIIHTMFRAFHTIKGLSGFVEHTVIQEIAHKTETLMDLCRKGEMKVNTKIVDAILKSSDYIKQLCEDIDSATDDAFLAKIEDHKVYLDDLVEDNEKSESEPEKVVQEELVSEDSSSEEELTQEEDPFAEEEKNAKAKGDKSEKTKNKKVEKENELNNDTKNTEQKVEVKEETKPESSKIEETFVNDELLNQDVKPEITEVKVEASLATEVKQQSTPAPVKKTVEERQPVAATATKMKSPSEEYMKVANSKIDHLVDMIGELIINQSLIEQYVYCNYPNDNRFVTNMAGLSRTTRELQDLSMFLRMVSLKPTFQKVTRIARDTIQELGKNVDFVVEGESTEIDRVVTDKLLDPLVHLIKNAISHGVEEDSADRTKANKPPKAKVELVAYNKRGSIYIDIKDDGRGIDTEIVYQKALEKGLIDPNREYTDEEIREFILLPGFSTAKQVDNISGRGVGMDVVKTQITNIGGRVDIKSEVGVGTTFTLKIPVNHAIMNGTVIELMGEQFIVPTVNVKEILQPKDNSWISTQQKKTMLRVRENIVPIVPTSLLFKDAGEQEKSALVLLLESEQDYRALPIDNVINRQEVVVKPLGEEFANLKYISGMSILGNGKVSLILDIDYLFTMEVKE